MEHELPVMLGRATRDVKQRMHGSGFEARRQRRLNDSVGRPEEMPDPVFPTIEAISLQFAHLDEIRQFGGPRDNVGTRREIDLDAAAPGFDHDALRPGRIDQSRVSVPGVEYE